MSSRDNKSKTASMKLTSQNCSSEESVSLSSSSSISGISSFRIRAELAVGDLKKKFNEQNKRK